MEKWTIKPAPTAYDPLRHLLFVKGDMGDVTSLLKRFGALCGRPKKESTPEGFNYSLPLHGVTTQAMERLSAALNEMSGVSPAGLAIRALPGGPAASPPAAGMPAPLIPPAPAKAPEDSDPFGAAPEPLTAINPPAGGLSLPSAPASAGPAAPDIPALPPAPSLVEKKSAQEPPAPQLVPLGPAADPPVEKPADSAPPAITLTPAPAQVEPELPAIPQLGAKKSAPEEKEPAPPEKAELPALAAAPPAPKNEPPPPAVEPPRTAPPAPEPVPQLSVRLPDDPQQSFDTLMVGPYDRFAHAAATSVVSSPGTMYNPLFLYGPPGVGKTHFMQSLANGLAGALGEGSVVLTTGSRLSFAVTQALMTKSYGALKEELAKAKALIVDDVHLTAVTEANRAALAEIFAHFFSANLQVVFSSLYPARALGGLEEALKISLAKGWAVDLKVPNPLVQVEILQSWLERHGQQLNSDDTRLFHERLGVAYPDLTRWLRRYLVLSKALIAAGVASKPSDVLNVLFDPGVAATDFPVPAELAAARGFQPPPAAADALKLAVVLPKGQEEMSGWAMKQFYDAGARYGIRRTYRHVLLQTYDAGQPFGVPFQIGDACHRAGAQAALVIGPPNDTSLAAKAAEFCHAVVHVLGSLGIGCGWVSHRGGMAPAPWLRAQLDLIRDAPV